MKIGFFDSGLGGLIILKAVIEHMPEYDYEYFGDTLHVPFGDKSEADIYRLTQAGVTELFERDCAIIIIACNTASAETLRRLQDEYLPHSPYCDRRILGVIIPVVEEVIASGVKRCLMLATRRTVSSGKYHLELGKRNIINTTIEALATPELVPFIEANQLDSALAFAFSLIDPRVGEVDGVILGCTHYSVMGKILKERYQGKLLIFSQEEIIPHKLKLYLMSHPELTNRLTRTGDRNIYLTEHRHEYDEIMASLLQS